MQTCKNLPRFWSFKHLEFVLSDEVSAWLLTEETIKSVVFSDRNPSGPLSMCRGTVLLRGLAFVAAGSLGYGVGDSGQRAAQRP